MHWGVGMVFRSRLAGLSLIALAAPLPALAQTQAGEGVSSFRTGLKGRIVEQRAQGVEPTRDASGRIDAGYYRLRFEPTLITEAAVCPRRTFRTSQDFARWRSQEEALYQKIFDKEGVWSITARANLHVGGVDRTPREIRLIAIENPEERNCKLKLAGSQDGDDMLLDQASVLVPFNSSNTVYEDRLKVGFKSVYKLEPDDARLDQLWSGINLFATTVSAGLGPIVGAVTPLGKTETARLLTTDVEAEAPVWFEADPGTGRRANRVFVHLAFPPLPQTLPQTLSGGMTIYLDYQASLFRRGQFYASAFPTAAPVRAAEVLSATPIPSTNAAAPGLRTVRDALGNGVYDALANAATPATFDGACSTARPALRALDLSEVDADVYLWAVAASSSRPEVSQHLGKLACFGEAQRANLKKLGVVVVDEVIVPPTTQATLGDMHAAMTSLGGIMQGGPGAPLNPDLTVRFAERIRLVLADDAAQGLIAQSEPSVERPRDEVLGLIAQHFSNIGCYAPRLGRDALMLALRPRFFELPANGRASAALALSREATPRAFILSFGFAPVPENGKAKIATVLIGRRGADNGDVVKELIVDRRPAGCNDAWMNEVFNP